MKFSVLMSVYIKESVVNLEECMDSIYRQTVMPDEIVIVEDGPISKELDECISNYDIKNKNLIKRVPLKQNMGLGLALAEGVKHCTNELIARMDTDDICVDNRFEVQLKEFEKNPRLDIVGGQILEFIDTINNVVARRCVPTKYENIKKYQKKRDAFNHVTVMFKKSAVLNAGNYQHALLMEDSLLWCNMLKNGSVAINVDDDLVYVRVGKDMIKRRGGWSYFLNYREGRKKILSTGYISYWDYISTVVAQFVVAMVPDNIRFFIFNKLLRRKK